MEDYYTEQLKAQKQELDLMTEGTISRVEKMILDHVEPATADSLTLHDVCNIADSLNFMLESLQRKQRDIDYTKKQLSDLKDKETVDDNHE